MHLSSVTVWFCSAGSAITLNKLCSCPFKISQQQQPSSENQILVQNGIKLPTPAAEMLLTSVLEPKCTLKQQSKQWRWVWKDVKCYCKRQQVEHFKSLSNIKLFLIKYLFSPSCVCCIWVFRGKFSWDAVVSGQKALTVKGRSDAFQARPPLLLNHIHKTVWVRTSVLQLWKLSTPTLFLESS